MKVSVDIPLDKAGIDKAVAAEMKRLGAAIKKRDATIARLTDNRNSWKEKAKDSDRLMKDQRNSLSEIREAFGTLIRHINVITEQELEDVSDMDYDY